jgi:hypothetical protein
MSSTLLEGNWKVALTESAQTYLQALDKKRKIAAARGGPAAEAAIVNEQKQQANYLAGDDDKMRVATANKLRRKNPTAKDTFEARQRRDNENKIARTRGASKAEDGSTAPPGYYSGNPILSGKKSGLPK